jgi:D-2-hydroxyglutarate dehydrogenase
VDLGAKGSCCIGGNVASNAGGQYYYRYGSIAANLLGLQVVLANGNILDLNYETRTNLKDNSGYKLHQLFVGSEGTLGVITGVALHCPKLAASRQAAFLACRSFESVLKVMEKAKQDLGEILVAAEWMDQAVVGILGQHSYSIPLKANYHSMHFLLVETHGCNVDHDREKLETFLESLFVSEHIDDGVVAQDVSQVMAFWKIRESANPVVMSTGYTYKYDVSLPGSKFDEFIAEMQDSLADLNVINTNWGHILDGNLHFNVSTPGVYERDDQVLSRLEPYLYKVVLRRGGSISAEHGLGQAKRKYLPLIHDEATLDAMWSMKRLFDPTGILNPHKYLPEIQNPTH